MTDEVKKREPRKFDDIGLRADVMRKMAHQLGRLPTREAKLNMAEFVAKVAAEDKVAEVKQSDKNGQHGLGLELDE